MDQEGEASSGRKCHIEEMKQQARSEIYGGLYNAATLLVTVTEREYEVHRHYSPSRDA